MTRTTIPVAAHGAWRHAGTVRRRENFYGEPHDIHYHLGTFRVRTHVDHLLAPVLSQGSDAGREPERPPIVNFMGLLT